MPRPTHPARVQLRFSFLAVRLSTLLHEVVAEQGRGGWNIALRFRHGKGPLAEVRYSPAGEAAVITLSDALDRPDVPEAVLRFLLRHEVLHLAFAHRPMHPPAFWQREAELAPDREECWAWLWNNMGHCLERHDGREGVFVAPKRVRKHGGLARARYDWRGFPY